MAFLNSTCATAIDVGLTPYTTTLDTTNADTDTEVTPSCDTSGGAKATWWSYRNPTAVYQLLEIDTDGDYYTNVSVWRGTCGSLVQVACMNFNYDTHKTYVSCAAAPGATYYIFITDNDAGLGGNLTVSVVALSLVDGGYVVTSAQSADKMEHGCQVYRVSDGALYAQDTSTGVSTTLALRESDRNVLAFGGTMYDLASSLGTLSTTALSHAAPASSPIWTGFSLNGRLFVLWSAGGGDNEHALQRLDPVTFAVIQEWSDWSVVLGNGSVLSPGCLSPNGNIFYYGAIGGTADDQNVIYAFDLTTEIETEFATYATWDGATSTGNQFPPRVWDTFADGRIITVTQHLTTGTIDNQHILIYEADGTLDSDYAMSPTGNILVQGGVLSSDEANFYAIDNFPHLSTYRLSDGTRTAQFTLDNAGVSLIFLPEVMQTPLSGFGDVVTKRIRRQRTAPHLWDGDLNHRLTYHDAELIYNAGEGEFEITLEISRDGGHTWGPLRIINAGRVGQYLKRAIWHRNGQARDFVARITESSDGPTTFVDLIFNPPPEQDES